MLAVLALAAVFAAPRDIATSAPAAQGYTPVTVNCSRPILDVRTGQPIMIGGQPWYVEAGDTILSHEWNGQPRYEYGGRRYHYIGSVSGPARFFIVEDCQQPQPAAPAPAPAPVVRQLADDTYAFSHSGYTTIFIVTSDGVIVGDPNGNARAAALKTAIQNVTAQPVKYVVYSHHDADHNTGAAVFKDTATFISHANAKDRIAARNDPNSPVPDRTFTDRMTLRLGATELDLRYVGRNHSDSSLVLLYPARRILWAVDFVGVNTLPFGTRAEDDYIAEWIESLRTVEAMDFDTVVPGHGNPGPKVWVRHDREYFEDLVRAIEEAERQGHQPNTARMTEFVRNLLAAKYGSWDNFGTRLPTNIQGMYAYWERNGRFNLQ